MENTEYQLLLENRVTLDANGEGWIKNVGPAQHGETWEIESTQTTVENSAGEARLRIYRNGTTQLVEGTYSANQDTSNTRFGLASGESLSFHYTNGSEGGTAIVTVSGVRKVRGKRAY